MSFQYSKLMDIATLATSSSLAVSAAASVYVNGSSPTYISEIEIHNTTADIASVILYLVPNASGSVGTASQANEFIRLTLSGYDTVWIEPKYPYVLTSTNDSIFGVSNYTNVNINIRGATSI